MFLYIGVSFCGARTSLGSDSLVILHLGTDGQSGLPVQVWQMPKSKCSSVWCSVKPSFNVNSLLDTLIQTLGSGSLSRDTQNWEIWCQICFPYIPTYPWWLCLGLIISYPTFYLWVEMAGLFSSLPPVKLISLSSFVWNSRGWTVKSSMPIRLILLLLF